jgi:hypothetical protein
VLKYPEFNFTTGKNVSLIDLALHYKNLSNKDNKIRILELGTKRSNVNSPTHHKDIFKNVENLEYIMTDYQEGLDVDVVCDLHYIENKLQKEYFDLIISCSTFEHLIYPILCSHNLMKLLKIGGRIFIQTHQTFPLHGYKYDYYRFSRECFNSIFSEKMKFKTLNSYFEHPCLVLPHKKIDGWNIFGETYLNIVYIGEKTDKTPNEYIYDIEKMFRFTLFLYYTRC